MSVLVLLICLLLHFEAVTGCQPPTPPIAYQHSPQPVAVPSPAYIPSDLVSGVAHHSAFGAQQFPQGGVLPQGPPIVGQEHLVPLQHNSIEDITPYPGYIPPPPEYPQLIQQEQQRPVVAQAVASHHVASHPIQQPIPPTAVLPSCTANIQSLREFMDCIKVLPPLPQDESAVNCEFEENSGCRFQPATPGFNFGRLPTAIHAQSLSRLARRQENNAPQGGFLYAFEQKSLPKEQELVISTPITCQSGSGIMKFDYWIVNNVEAELRVCTQDHLARSCTQPIVYTESPTVTVEVVHPNATVFSVEISVSNVVVPTLVIFDNLQYTADLCDKRREEASKSSVQHTPVSLVESFFEEDGPIDQLPSRPIESEEPSMSELVKQLDEQVNHVGRENEPTNEEVPAYCNMLACGFDGDLCQYTNYKNESLNLADWKVGSQKVGNKHTGIRKTDGKGGFLYVGTDSISRGQTTYILESPTVTLPSDVTISFDVYRRSNDISLQICLDTPVYCPYQISKFQKDIDWQEGETFVIPKTTKKILIKAIQWRKFKWLAIDNLRIKSSDCKTEERTNRVL